MQEIFEKMDWDKNGTISCIEFKSYLAKLKKGEDLDHAECVEAFNAIDVDGSKQINWNEFFVSSFFSHRIQHRFAIVSVIKSVSKNRLQHWHSHCDFSMNILANYYFILQISHAKTFKMRYSSSK